VKAICSAADLAKGVAPSNPPRSYWMMAIDKPAEFADRVFLLYDASKITPLDHLILTVSR